MKKTFTQSMSWLHTWGGLTISWLLFAVLLTGSIAVFNSEITYWLTPEMRPHVQRDQHQVLDRALNVLQAEAPDSRLWRVTLPTVRAPVVAVTWRTEKGKTESRRFDPETFQPLTRKTEGGAFYLHFHEGLHIDRAKNRLGLYIVGLTGMAMIVACVSGIVVHKRIFKDFFLFRRKASAQRSWLDAHNLFGVLALPFHLIMAYTGLLLLYWMYVPAAVQTLWDGDEKEFRRVAITQEYRTVTGDPGAPAQMTDLVALMQRAEAQLGIGRVHYLYVRDPNRNNAVIEFSRMRDDQVSQQVDQIAFDAVTGQTLRVLDDRSLTFRAQSFVAALHWIEWGGAPARWAYFLAGLMSSAMVGAGMIVFTAKNRRPGVGPRARRVIEALNVAGISGISVACIAYLWTERLMPLGLENRSDQAINIFFLVWLATGVHAALRSYKAAFVEQFALVGLLCLAAPFLGGFVFEHVSAADWGRIATDITLITLGLASLGGAALVAGRRSGTRQTEVAA